MNHGLKLHPDGTLEITMPKDKKVTRVLVCEAGTQNAKLYYPEINRDTIDHYLFRINSYISPHTSVTSVIAIKHYMQKLYEEIYGEGEKPKWMI